jgi:hypothetical protein
MCGTGANLIRPIMEREVAKDKSHKHHKSMKSIVRGGDPKRKLVPPGRQQ